MTRRGWAVRTATDHGSLATEWPTLDGALESFEYHRRDRHLNGAAGLREVTGGQVTGPDGAVVAEWGEEPRARRRDEPSAPRSTVVLVNCSTCHRPVHPVGKFLECQVRRVPGPHGPQFECMRCARGETPPELVLREWLTTAGRCRTWLFEHWAHGTQGRWRCTVRRTCKEPPVAELWASGGWKAACVLHAGEAVGYAEEVK